MSNKGELGMDYNYAPREPGYSDYGKQWGWHGTYAESQLVHPHVLPMKWIEAMGCESGYIGFDTREEAMAALVVAAARIRDAKTEVRE